MIHAPKAWGAIYFIECIYYSIYDATFELCILQIFELVKVLILSISFDIILCAWINMQWAPIRCFIYKGCL